MPDGDAAAARPGVPLPPFALATWLSHFQHSVKLNLAASDMQTLTVGELLALGSPVPVDGLLSLPLSYTDSDGKESLRAKIAGLYQTAKADDVLTFAGAEEAVYIFAQAVLKAGDHVVVQWPCYQPLADCPRAAGCDVTPWQVQLDDATYTWKADLGELEKAIRPGQTRALIVNSPHNPTGYTLDVATMCQIVELCRKHKLLLWCDEVYRGIERGDHERTRAACDEYEDAISLVGTSKAYGMAGLRIGWIVTRNRQVRAAMAAFKDYVSHCNSAPSEFLTEVAISKHAAILQRNNDIVNRNLALLRGFMARHKDLFTWAEPAAGCISYARLNGGRSADKFCSTLVDATGVLIAPAKLFDPAGDSYVRIGLGRTNFPEGIAKLEEYLASAAFKALSL